MFLTGKNDFTILQEKWFYDFTRKHDFVVLPRKRDFAVLAKQHDFAILAGNVILEFLREM